jgi:hypothetical protein
LFTVQLNNIRPAKDAHGTTLTNTVSNDDGSITCIFNNGACHYDVSAILSWTAYTLIKKCFIIEHWKATERPE